MVVPTATVIRPSREPAACSMKRLANDTGSGIKKWETPGRFTFGKSCLVRQAERTWSAASGIAGKKWMKATKKWVARKMILVLASSLIWILSRKAITATYRN